jgi:hypothetical protein
MWMMLLSTPLWGKAKFLPGLPKVFVCHLYLHIFLCFAHEIYLAITMAAKLDKTTFP